MNVSEMVLAKPDQPQSSGQVRTDSLGAADECGPQQHTSPTGEERRATGDDSSTANTRLGLLIVVVTGAVVYGAIAMCIAHFL